MKTILYLAMSANGYIARLDNTTDWSEDEWSAYNQMLDRSGNLIIGRKTYDIMAEEGSLEHMKGKVVVLTKHIPTETTDNKVVFFNDTPANILAFLETEGFDTAIIGGGSQVTTLFMREKLVDELWIDVEPKVFGKGIPFFWPDDFEATLKLKTVANLSDDTVHLEYTVVK